MFVNVEHPSQLSRPKTRKLVRSHISRLQHAQKRSAVEQEVKHQLHLQESTESKSTLHYDSSTLNLSPSDIDASPITQEASTKSPAIHELNLPCLRPPMTIIRYHDRPPSPLRSRSRGNRMRCPEEELPSWEEVAEEDSEDVSPLASTTPKSQDAAWSLCHAAKHASASRIHFSFNEPNDELQTFARQLGISVTAILVCLRRSTIAERQR